MARILSLTLAGLTLLGLTAATSRALFPASALARAEPLRADVLRFLELEDPREAERPAEVARFESRFAASPIVTRLHVVSGGVFLLLAPLQFSTRIRERHLRAHRASGRVLVASGLAAAATGLHFGIRVPYGGALEAAIIVLVGALFLFALARAVVAVRSGDVARHREWMIRAFAVSIGVSTVRVFAALLDLGFTPLGVHLIRVSESGMGRGEVQLRRRRRLLSRRDAARHPRADEPEAPKADHRDQLRAQVPPPVPAPRRDLALCPGGSG